VLTDISHTIYVWSLVPMWPTETALWQSQQWIIGLLASRNTSHTAITRDPKYEMKFEKDLSFAE